MPIIVALTRFWKGLCRYPLFWQAWAHFIIFINIGGACLFWNQELSLWVVASMFASFAVGLLIVYIHGFTKLIGLMHLAWIPMITHAIALLDIADITSPFGLWIRLLLIVNGVTLAVDTINIARYILGNRVDLLH